MVINVSFVNLHLVKAFPSVVTMLGMSGVFFAAAVASAVGAIVSLICIPRTRNKSLYELETMFQERKKEEVY